MHEVVDLDLERGDLPHGAAGLLDALVDHIWLDALPLQLAQQLQDLHGSTPFSQQLQGLLGVRALRM